MAAKVGLADRLRRWAVVDSALEEFSPPAIEPNFSERKLDRQDRYLVTLLGENLAVASVRCWHCSP
jgi:hypothetical protein